MKKEIEMDKNEFVLKLKEALKNKFSEIEISEAISYYEEIIAEGVEAGKTEAEIIEGFGDIEKIVARITVDIVENRSDSKDIKKSWKSFVAILAICTSPILVLLAIGFVAIAIGLFLGFLGSIVGLISSFAIAIIVAVPLLLSGTLGIGNGFIVTGILIFALSFIGMLLIWAYQLAVFLFNKITKLFSRVIKKKVEVNTNA